MAVLKDLIVHGSSRFINGINADTIHANLVDANDGVFKTITTTILDAETITTDMLNATNARVSQTLTVDGTISTNKWEAANIANIGGNFYISPTGKADTGTITVTKTDTTTINGVTIGVYTIVVGGTFGVASTSSTIWGTSSKVIFTGSISYNSSKKYPLGTCNGTMTVVSTDTNTLTGFTITGINSSALDIFFKEVGVTSVSNTACNGYEMQISVYQSYYSSALHPIGILLTSYGKEKKQYIDIYGGANTLGDSASGYAEPSVRIGQLDGLPNIVDGSTATDTQPTGWGIYTTNGFFKGKIVSNVGKIGNFTIANELYSGTEGIGQSNNVYVSAGTQSSVDIAGSLIEPYQLTNDETVNPDKIYYTYSVVEGEGIYTAVVTPTGNPREQEYYEEAETEREWAFTAGNSFGVTTNGQLFANDVKIAGEITASSISIQHTNTDNTISVIDLDEELNIITSNISIDGANGTIRIGNPSEFNLLIEKDRLSFNEKDLAVAYLTNQQLYISQSVVLEQMDLGLKTSETNPVTSEAGHGQWSWKVHRNKDGLNNLYLKWIG